ncbi:uncharacterized protein (UPF0548 family) [Glaciihabitans tibetensis]|uniref:Uncharacterized protein (UPF0548 family) n=1 Tax=Glaciihabitans tibetensis TaxID=1266600 RepID=A0A2T0V4F4_9MICO|nr:DUF1990 domain-containing protein [Glaciihabitans tibetensis]PRY65007.1 uncharacterized protein (UPF0548 family) [Glaciihabitans tibetensis]
MTGFTRRESPTLFGQAPAGYRLTERSRVIGSGDADFTRARDLIWLWRIQTGSRFLPVQMPERVIVGVVSQFRIPFGPLRPMVTCRVFSVVDEPRLAGFAHEAIRGHPQSGWESFLVELGADGDVTLRVRVVSRASAWWMRAAGPAAHVALLLLLRRNLRSLDAHLR